MDNMNDIEKSGIKTYVFFDLIGTKEALREGRNPSQNLENYWIALKEATKQGNSGYVDMNSHRYGLYQATPEPVVRVWSDSALLWMNNEIAEISDFYMTVESFLKVLGNFEVSVYCIINRDTETYYPELFEHSHYSNPPKIAFELGPSAGPAWTNIYLADLELQNRKDWHNQYNLYCVGEENLSNDYEIKGRFSFKGFEDMKKELLAIEKGS